MIEEKTQNELRELFNPDGSPLRKHQLKMLEILKYVDKICKDNGIKYWLSSGTCLGAVRHNGFIPWDDDVDIEMMREDYLKFERIFTETDKYVFQTYKNDFFYPFPFGKVRDKDSIIYDSLYKYRGAFVDIFSLEYTSKSLSYITYKFNSLFGWHLYNFIKKKKQNYFLFNSGTYVFFCIKKIYFHMMPFLRFIEKFIPQKKLRHTLGVGWVNNTRDEKDIFPLCSVLFEDTTFPIPNNYDSYLKKLYGDYMTIPDLDKIQKPHVQYLVN